jgi:hypothetical protein
MVDKEIDNKNNSKIIIIIACILIAIIFVAFIIILFVHYYRSSNSNTDTDNSDTRKPDNSSESINKPPSTVDSTVFLNGYGCLTYAQIDDKSFTNSTGELVTPTTTTSKTILDCSELCDDYSCIYAKYNNNSATNNCTIYYPTSNPNNIMGFTAVGQSKNTCPTYAINYTNSLFEAEPRGAKLTNDITTSLNQLETACDTSACDGFEVFLYGGGYYGNIYKMDDTPGITSLIPIRNSQ